MARNPQADAPSLPIALAVGSILIFAAVCLLRNRTLSMSMVALMASAGYIWIKAETYPYIDRSATARPIARQIQSLSAPACVKDIPRDWRYGLNYYTEKPLPDCWHDPAARAFVCFQNHRVFIETP